MFSPFIVGVFDAADANLMDLAWMKLWQNVGAEADASLSRLAAAFFRAERGTWRDTRADHVPKGQRVALASHRRILRDEPKPRDAPALSHSGRPIHGGTMEMRTAKRRERLRVPKYAWHTRGGIQICAKPKPLRRAVASLAVGVPGTLCAVSSVVPKK
jgi:hypothetical protein